MNYNTEQESNRFLKKKTFDSASRYQSKAIPIPRVISTFNASATGAAGASGVESGGYDETGAVNFMGRVMSSLLYLTGTV